MTSMTANKNIEKRRRYYHTAVMQTLEKHRDALLPEIYTEVCMERIIQERDFSLNVGLLAWDRELELSWKRQLKGMKVPFDKRKYYWYKYWKMKARSIVKKLRSVL